MLAPDARPAAGTGLLVPRAPARPQKPVVARVNTVPQNSSSSGISPSSSAWRYLRRRDLEVVGARDRQVDLGRAGEAGDHRRDVRPQERPQRVAPPRRLAEELDEPLLLVGVVAPPLRLDPDLAPQRERVHGAAGRAR